MKLQNKKTGFVTNWCIDKDVIRTCDGKFFVKDWDFGDGSYHIVDFYDYNVPRRDFEVIGNIHENPELLGDEE